MGGPAALHEYLSTEMVLPLYNIQHPYLRSTYSSFYQSSTCLHLNMAPKTHFTVPLNRTADASAPTQRGRRATRTTEKISLDHTPKRGTSSKASGSRRQVHKHAEISEEKESGDPSKETVETYPLQFIDPQYDADADDLEDVKQSHPPSNVSAVRLVRTIH